ncbi:hypothetical protein E2P81_ATG01685 [Venturia nashicola]|nr:hypothetical protein E2P81_ATG01685 [Venturia nashicola]
MAPPTSIPQEQIQTSERSLKDQLAMQSKQLSLFQDFAHQVIWEISTIQTEEVVPRVQNMLQAIMERFTRFSKDVSRIQDLPLDAVKETISPISRAGKARQQQQQQKMRKKLGGKDQQFPVVPRSFEQEKRNFVEEMLAIGYKDGEEIAFAFDAAGGVKELAVSGLTSLLSFPATPGPQAGDVDSQWDGSGLEANSHNFMEKVPVTPEQGSQLPVAAQPWDGSLANNFFDNGRDIANHILITPVSRKRKADASFIITSPSPAQPSVSSSIPSHIHTPPRTPATAHPTHLPFTPSTYLARRKPSSISPQEQSALFDIIQRLAPSSKVNRFWTKVTESLAELGYHKTEAAWKGEWSRYGTYEHGFDERTGVFVQSEVEKLKLLRCLDNKPKAEVMRAIQELEEGLEEELEEDEDDVVFVSFVKRQKMMGGFESVGSDVLSAAQQTWLAGSGFPPQECIQNFALPPAFQDQEPFEDLFSGFPNQQYVKESNGPIFQGPFDPNFSNFSDQHSVENVQTPQLYEPFNPNNSDFVGKQYAQEVENFGCIEEPEVEAANNHRDQVDIRGFDFQNDDLFPNIDKWFSGGLKSGTGDQVNLDTDQGAQSGGAAGVTVSTEKELNSVIDVETDNRDGSDLNVGGDWNLDEDLFPDDDNPYIASLREFQQQMEQGY